MKIEEQQEELRQMVGEETDSNNLYPGRQNKDPICVNEDIGSVSSE